MKSMMYPKLRETIYYERLANGLEVFMLPKKDFHRTFATFSAKYGSVDNKFLPKGKEQSTKLPNGIAHFLEHKMFDSKQGNVFQTFAKKGAAVNAFTNFTCTTYTLSATSNINENLTALLDFVQDPYFTDETVAMEREIIAQEIKMCDDNPDWRARFGLLENMYKNHPVKNDIAGTIASIKQITKDNLYCSYHSFYHPSNMLLFVIGPVVPKDVIKCIRNNQAKKTFRQPEEIQRIYPYEDKKVNRRSRVMTFPVQIPKVYIGYKESDPIRQGKELLKYELSLNVLYELMFGCGSDVYEEMYDSGYIDRSFTYDYKIENGFGFSVISGDSQEPEKVIKIVNKTIALFKKQSIKKEDAQRIIKKTIGSFLSAINSPQYIANQFTRYRFNDMDLFEVISTLENMTEKDVEEVLHLHFSDVARTTLIIKEG